jgi:superfamily II DNA or RNA helicase
VQELIEPVGYADKYVFLPHGFHALATMRKAHGKALDLGDTFAVPHGVKSARKLREMGYGVRSPVDDEYEYPLVKKGKRMPPLTYQREVTDFMVMHPRCFVFVDMGLGKTVCALWTWHYLFQKKMAGRMLVLCPRSIMISTWVKGVTECFPHISVAVVRGSAEQRAAAVNGRADILIANHDAVKTTPALHTCKRTTHVCIDEATAFASSMGKDSARAKAAWKLCANKNTWVMTATPVTQSPVKAYGLCKMVDPLATARAIQEVTGFVGRSSKTAWKEATMRADYMVGGQPRGNMRPTSDAERLVFAALQPAIRFKKSEVLDLPGFEYEDRHVLLSAPQEQFYKQLVKDWVVEDKSKGGKVTAVNAGVKMRKLLQSFQGAVLKEDGTTLDLDNNPRINEVFDIIDQSEGKVVIFTTYVASNAGVKAAIDAKYGPGTVVVMNGKSSDAERNAAVDRFEDTSPSNPVRVLVAHPQVGAFGHTLIAASSIIWFGPYERAELVLQADNRTDRIGQTMRQTIYRLIGEHANGKLTIEADIYSAIYNDKIAVEQRILELYENLTNGVR